MIAKAICLVTRRRKRKRAYDVCKGEGQLKFLNGWIDSSPLHVQVRMAALDTDW